MTPLSVVIPALNEAKKLPENVARLLEYENVSEVEALTRLHLLLRRCLDEKRFVQRHHQCVRHEQTLHFRFAQ